MFRRLSAIAVALFLVPLAVASGSGAADAAEGRVSIDGTRFFVGGEVSHPGTGAEGVLLNSRMTNALFDDENAATRSMWAYPDTGVWSAQRNTDEFVAALPTYKSYGLDAVSINLQGGNPVSGCSCNATHEWITSAFRSDGTLKPAWTARADQAISAAAANDMVVVLGITYHGQDERIADESGVVRATDEVTDWLLARGHRNVLVEIANEGNHSLTSHAIVKNRVHELIARVQDRSNGALLVSSGFTGGTIPPDAVLRQSDFVIMHGNGQDAARIEEMVAEVRSSDEYQAEPKPIVFTEDSTRLANFDAAVAAGAGWGFHDKGSDDYRSGFQTVPINWRLSTATKKAFFDRVAVHAGSLAPTTSTSTTTPTGPGVFAMFASTSASRSGAISFDGTTVAGDVFVFTGPDPGVSKVAFHVDDTSRARAPYQVEHNAPFDLAGGTATIANPFDTTDLTDGAHTITAALTLSSGAAVVVHAAFVVANDPTTTTTASTTPTTVTTTTPTAASTTTTTTAAPGAYGLVVSTTSDRTDAVPLANATIRRYVFVFAVPDVFAVPEAGVQQVSFFVDDPTMAGVSARVEFAAPYDLAGGDVDTARSYDTTRLANGVHTITAAALLTDGSIVTTTAPFTVAN